MTILLSSSAFYILYKYTLKFLWDGVMRNRILLTTIVLIWLMNN